MSHGRRVRFPEPVDPGGERRWPRAAALVAPYERKKGEPLYRPLRIYAHDAAESRLDGAREAPTGAS